MTEVSPAGLEAILAPFVATLGEQNTMIARQNELLAEQTALLKKMHWEANKSRITQEAMRATLAAPILDSMQAFLDGRQLSLLGTIDEIRDKKLNLARFGDGEMRLMLRLDFNLKFQRNTPALQEALAGVIDFARDSPDKLLIGLPQPYRDLFWSGVHGDMWRQVESIVEDIPRFANSHISRPIMFEVHGQDAVNAWRTIWEGLDVTVVTGEGSRFGLTPELFDNVRSTRFEYSLPAGAFVDVPRMIDVLKDDPSDLVLLSLGPSGTIIAAELARHGKWALDIGHLSNSYEYEFKSGNFPEAVPHVRTA